MRRKVAIIDAHAGAEIGHHRHWLSLLRSDLGDRVDLFVLSKVDGDTATDRIWYQNATATAIEASATDVVFLSGDDALASVLRRSRMIRNSGSDVHVLLFRADRQQQGIASYIKQFMRVGVLAFLTITIKRLHLYALTLPVGKPQRWQVLLGIEPVADSSAIEAPPVGDRIVARRRLGISESGGVVLVIGMLGLGKYVDTFVRLWEDDPPEGCWLVLAGQADEEVERLVQAAQSRNVPRLIYIARRLTDQEFDDLLTSANLVSAVYRYSASSGVALRSLAMGRRLLVGGSRTLLRQLKGIPGVLLLGHVSANALREVISAEWRGSDPEPLVLQSPEAQFPRPIVRAILRNSAVK